jgi:type II secretory pathway pseudopilin PulG
MSTSGNAKKYPAFTLLEMLLVLGILTILGTVTATSFGGLESSVTLNEESQNISQDIRNLQRSAMLLEREANESWLYGLGIDFSSYETTGEYRMFKWCSPYSGYGSTKTRSELPDFDDEVALGVNNGYLPISSWEAECSTDTGLATSYLVEWNSGTPTFTDTGLNPDLLTWGEDLDPAYILFESVSGRAFFYNSEGTLLNYNASGDLVGSPVDFALQMDTRATVKTITVKNLSGRILIDAQAND